MEESQLNKLNYISRVIEKLDKNMGKKNAERGSFPKWSEIDKFSSKLMNNFIAEEKKKLEKCTVFSKNDFIKHKQLDVNFKKMNVLHLFLNTCIMTILIKYLDMIERVRFGCIKIL